MRARRGLRSGALMGARRAFPRRIARARLLLRGSRARSPRVALALRIAHLSSSSSSWRACRQFSSSGTREPFFQCSARRVLAAAPLGPPAAGPLGPLALGFLSALPPSLVGVERSPCIPLPLRLLPPDLNIEKLSVRLRVNLAIHPLSVLVGRALARPLSHNARSIRCAPLHLLTGRSLACKPGRRRRRRVGCAISRARHDEPGAARQRGRQAARARPHEHVHERPHEGAHQRDRTHQRDRASRARQADARRRRQQPDAMGDTSGSTSQQPGAQHASATGRASACTSPRSTSARARASAAQKRAVRSSSAGGGQLAQLDADSGPLAVCIQSGAPRNGTERAIYKRRTRQPVITKGTG